MEEKINKAKSWLFEKIDKIGQLLVRLTKKKSNKISITNIINKERVVTIDSMDIKRTINNIRAIFIIKNKCYYIIMLWTTLSTSKLEIVL